LEKTMPDTPKTRPITVDEFRAASDASQPAAAQLLTKHRTPLGGDLGVIHALTELLGSLCKATIDLAPQAKPSIGAQLQQLLLYVETAGWTPQ
jgi:hypothetical protein